MIKLQSVNRERWQSSLLCGLSRRLYWEALGGGRRGCKTCSGWFKILLNNCLSAAEHRVAKSSISLSQTPDRSLLLRKACSFCQSVALEKPIQELDAYSNLWERQIYRYCGGHYHATHVHVKLSKHTKFVHRMIWPFEYGVKPTVLDGTDCSPPKSALKSNSKGRAR